MRSLVGIATFVIAMSGADALASEREDFPGQDKAFRRAFQAIEQHKLLTPKEMECVLLTAFDPPGRVVSVDVRAKHNRKCGGDPNFAPRLFSIDIDLKTRAARWDGDGYDGEMRPLPIDGGRPVPVDHWASVDDDWSRYTGGRFGTITEVPEKLFDKGKPTPDGRRRTFRSKDDDADLHIFGLPQRPSAQRRSGSLSKPRGTTFA
jgi:hypothetical protein